MRSPDADSAQPPMEERPSETARQRIRWRRRLGRLLLALVTAELLYIGAFEWAARSGRLERWVNRRPEKIAISFAEAHSFFPFWGSVAGLELRGQSPRLRWRAEVEAARGWLAPLPLLERRIRLLRPRASGVRIWMLRTDLDPSQREAERSAEAPGPEAASPPIALPPIEPLAPPPSIPRPVRPKWGFELPGFRAESIRELWFDEIRVSGEIAASGALSMREGKVLDVEPSVVEFGDVLLEFGGHEIGAGFSGAAELRVASLPFREKRGLDALPFVDATLRFGGRLSFGELAAPLLERAAWLAVESDEAPVEGELRIVAGELRPGSRVSVPRSRLRARFYDFRTVGHASIDFAVVDDPEGARGDLAVRFDEFEIARGESERPEIVGSGLSVLASTRDLRPAPRLPVAVATLDLGEARVPDLAVFDPVIPPTVDLHLVSGSGRVTGGAELRLPELSVEGGVSSRIADTAVRYGDLDLVGTATLDVAVQSPDIGSGRFDLSGTRFELSDFGSPQIAAAAAGEAGWWTKILVDRAEVTMPPATAAEGEITVTMRDSVPFVGLFETRKNLPRWIERLLTVKNLRAEAAFAYRPLDFTLERFAMGFRKSKIQARMHFGPEQRAGVMMIEWRRLALGLRFDGDRKRFKFAGVRDWFARQDLSQPTSPTSAAGSDEAFSDEAIAAATFVGIGPAPLSLADQEAGDDEETPAGAGFVLLAGSLARGDLDGDDLPDGVLLLGWAPAGEPSRVHLAAIADRDGRVENLATTPLPAGTEVRSLRIDGGLVELDLVVTVAPAAVADAACCPSSKVRERWRLAGGELTLAAREPLGPLTATDLAGARLRLLEIDGGEQLPDGFELALDFDGARVVATGPCGQIEGEYALAPAAVLSATLAETPASDCAPASRRIEESVRHALAGGGSLAFTPGRVAFATPGGDAGRLLFAVEPGPPPPER